MLKELYTCDRKGCKNTTEATGLGPFFYADPSWMGVKLTNSENPADICSFECLLLWAQGKVDQRRGG